MAPIDPDVLAVLPAFVRRSDSAPVRDAICAALSTIVRRYRELTSYAAGQCEIATATGMYLEGLCEDRGVYRQPDESDDSLRARALTAPDLVTPEAILAAANTVLAPYTAVQAEYAESILDRWYVQDGSASWQSFLGANPRYQKRYYSDDAADNGGVVRPNSRIGGAWAFSDMLGRYFVLRVPELTSLSRSHAFLPGSFAADGSNPGGREAIGRLGLFIYADPSTTLTVYQAIASAVSRVKGHSVRWQLVADSRMR